MSTFTKNWSVEKIRAIIRKLDEKTGLRGADLPIDFSCYGWFLGLYHCGESKGFSFNRKFFDDPHTMEAEVLDIIRHEYGHFYCEAANLAKYIGHSNRGTSHGDDWKWACKMVGADPTRCHNADIFSSKNWTAKEALAAYNAEDVEKFDILAFLAKWDQVPVAAETAEKLLNRIKVRNPNAFYEIGDEVLHPRIGFGVVQDAIPYDRWTQKIHVHFENNTDGVFIAKDLCKVVDGKVITNTPRR